MVSRKSHPKSRNGCAQCKRRRIKCDEKRPQCSNCVKHSIDCDFSVNPFDPSKTSSPSPHSQTHSHRGSDTTVAPQSSVGTSPTMSHSLHGTRGSHLPDLQMCELELLHHFTTETCYTLSDRAESHRLWQIVAPQVAMHHAFLMRGIFAISALHLSCLKPEMQDHYAHIAVKNQDAALSSFRSIMSKMDQSNCDAFFALSSLIVVYGFESPKAADSLGMFNYNEEQSDDWLPLIRGVNSIIQSVWPWIKSGRLSGLLHDHIQESARTELPNVLSEQLSQLNTLFENSSAGQEAIGAYKTALEILRSCFVRMNNRPPYECEVSIAFLWPVIVPVEFLKRLNMREPEALILLAHYCVILHHLDDYWWMRGWAMHIINNIHRELDDNWRYWIQWPTSVVTVDEKLLTNGTLQTPIQGTRVSSDFDTAIDRSLVTPSQELKGGYKPMGDSAVIGSIISKESSG